jgi:hypothetical protein
LGGEFDESTNTSLETRELWIVGWIASALLSRQVAYLLE